MKPIWRERLQIYGMLLALLSLLAWMFRPLVSPARQNARRMHCLSNLRKISQACQLYALDYDQTFPPVENWTQQLQTYSKTSLNFQCPSENSQSGFTDYWLNARIAGLNTSQFKAPQQTFAFGDGNDGTNPTDASYALSQLPPNWLKDKESPAWRHLDGANYGFADGHVKWLRPKSVSNLPPQKAIATFLAQ